jgi:hypothetical protein
MDNPLKENKTSVLRSPQKPSILNSPIKLPSILVSKKSRSEIPLFELDSPGKKITSFAKAIPIKMPSNKSISMLEESEEFLLKPPKRKMTCQSPTKKFSSMVPVRKLTSRVPIRKNTSNDIYRSETMKLDILNSTNFEYLRNDRKTTIDKIQKKIEDMSDAKTDMKRIHMKNVFSNVEIEKQPEDNIHIDIQKEIVIKSPIKSLRTFLHKNTYSIIKINKKEKIDEKSVNFKLAPVMQKRKREILKIAGDEFKTFLNNQKQISTFINERLKVIKEFNFDEE